MEPTPTNKPIIPSELQKRATVPKPSSKTTPAFVQPPMRFGNLSNARRSVFPTETPKTTNAVEPASKSAQAPSNGQVKNLPAARDRRSVFPETPNVMNAKENGASSRFVQPRMRFGNVHEARPLVLSDNPSTSSTARCRCSRITTASTAGAGVLGIPIRRVASRRAPSKDSKSGENVEPGQQQE